MASELPVVKREKKVEVLTPRVYLHYASSISGLRGVADKNMILHRLQIPVKYVKSYDGDTRICIVSDGFDNVDKLPILEGQLFVVSDPLTAEEHGVHVLVYPMPDGDSADMKTLQRNIAREKNLQDIERMISTEAKWVPVSFWKHMGEEGRGLIEIMPPSTKVTIFTPSEQRYSPEPGMEEFLLKGVDNLWGELAADTKHPAYKRMATMR